MELNVSLNPPTLILAQTLMTALSDPTLTVAPGLPSGPEETLRPLKSVLAQAYLDGLRRNLNGNLKTVLPTRNASLPRRRTIQVLIAYENAVSSLRGDQIKNLPLSRLQEIASQTMDGVEASLPKDVEKMLPEDMQESSDTGARRVFSNARELNTALGLDLNRLKRIRRIPGPVIDGEENPPLHDPVYEVELSGHRYLLKVAESMHGLEETTDLHELALSEVAAASLINRLSHLFPRVRAPRMIIVRNNNQNWILAEFLRRALHGKKHQAAWNRMNRTERSSLVLLGLVLGNRDNLGVKSDNVLFVAGPEGLYRYVIDNEFSFGRIDSDDIRRHLEDAHLDAGDARLWIKALDAIISTVTLNAQRKALTALGLSASEAESRISVLAANTRLLRHWVLNQPKR